MPEIYLNVPATFCVNVAEFKLVDGIVVKSSFTNSTVLVSPWLWNRFSLCESCILFTPVNNWETAFDTLALNPLANPG